MVQFTICENSKYIYLPPGFNTLNDSCEALSVWVTLHSPKAIVHKSNALSSNGNISVLPSINDNDLLIDGKHLCIALS